MLYKKKLIFLSALVVILALTYALILFLDRDVRRSDIFAWLDANETLMATRLEIANPDAAIVFNRRDGIWFLEAPGAELPVRQSKVDDLFALLSRRALYPVRAVSPDAIARLGLNEASAYRIRIHGGHERPLLDLLVGGEDILGREVYLRLAGQNQIHSGEGNFMFFTNLNPIAWYNLNLFSPFNIDVVQQADVILPGGNAFTLQRSGTGWVMLGETFNPEPLRVEAWLRSVVEVQGDDFIFDTRENIDESIIDEGIILGSIVLRLGDGTTRALDVMGGSGNWLVMVAGSSLVYTLSDWNFDRLFREREFFAGN